MQLPDGARENANDEIPKCVIGAKIRAQQDNTLSSSRVCISHVCKDERTLNPTMIDMKNQHICLKTIRISNILTWLSADHLPRPQKCKKKNPNHALMVTAQSRSLTDVYLLPATLQLVTSS